MFWRYAVSESGERRGGNFGEPRTLRDSVAHRVAVAALLLCVINCGGGGRSPTATVDDGGCGGYPAAETSPYVLPFPVGVSAPVFQGNCGPWTHYGPLRYATDFALDPGSVAVAARRGEVVAVREHFRDDIDINRGQSNYVMILHADGTVAYYGHFSQDGVTVELGAVVARGERIGFTGATGYIGPTPHLHIEIQSCQGCASIPMTFRNADPPDTGGLVMGTTYTALPY